MESFRNVRPAAPHEFNSVGELMVSVYQQLDGFPKPVEQPAYYEMLANVGSLTTKPGTEIFVAIENDLITGAVVYFDDMQYYGSGGTATREKFAAGFRLLAVDPRHRGKGIGKLLTLYCIEKARDKGHQQLIIHTTRAMLPAWKMYEKLGFQRSIDLDFKQGELEVFGFRLNLK